jgi:hypothetical protein
MTMIGPFGVRLFIAHVFFSQSMRADVGRQVVVVSTSSSLLSR